MKILFRNMKYTDLNPVIDINYQTLPEHYEKKYWDKWFSYGKQSCFVAIVNSKIIGYILTNGTNIMSFAVVEAHRKMGVGQMLLNHCLNQLKEKTVSLYVRTDSKAVLLYEKYKFYITKHIPDYYKNPDCDAFYMSLDNVGIDYNIVKKLSI